jgi:hypothetical protein
MLSNLRSITLQMKLYYRRTTRCSKRKIADSTQDSLPIGKRHHSQSIRTLPSAYNEQLSTSNEALKDKTSMKKRKREKCPYDKSKVSQTSRILGKTFCQEYVQESTSGNAHLTKSSYNCGLNQTQDLPAFVKCNETISTYTPK